MADDKENMPSQQENESPDNGASGVGPVRADDTFEHTKISGRYDKYRSAYWPAAIAVLGMRNTGRAFTRQWWGDGVHSFFKYMHGGIAGLLMYAVVAIYAKSTWKDIRNIYTETVAWEKNKKPEDVTFFDIWRSKNDIIHRTVKNYRFYNLSRAAINLPFFLPFIPGFEKFFVKSLKGIGVKDLNAESGVDWGVGLNSAYLFKDVIYREETFFELLQKFVDQKINHTDRTGDIITAADLISLYDRHAKDKNPNYTYSGRMDTQRWENDQRLFGRIAKLMNQTYKNEPNPEEVNFTLPKLIYLLGNGLIDPKRMDRSNAYIEIAGHNSGMEEVKKVTAALESGVPLPEAIRPFMPKIAEQKTLEANHDVVTHSHTERLGEKPRNVSRETLQPPPATHAEKALMRQVGNSASLAAV